MFLFEIGIEDGQLQCFRLPSRPGIPDRMSKEFILKVKKNKPGAVSAL